jgi:hypothetical protein
LSISCRTFWCSWLLDVCVLGCFFQFRRGGVTSESKQPVDTPSRPSQSPPHPPCQSSSLAFPPLTPGRTMEPVEFRSRTRLSVSLHGFCGYFLCGEATDRRSSSSLACSFVCESYLCCPGVLEREGGDVEVPKSCGRAVFRLPLLDIFVRVVCCVLSSQGRRAGGRLPDGDGVEALVSACSFVLWAVGGEDCGWRRCRPSARSGSGAYRRGSGEAGSARRCSTGEFVARCCPGSRPKVERRVPPPPPPLPSAGLASGGPTSWREVVATSRRRSCWSTGVRSAWLFVLCCRAVRLHVSERCTFVHISSGEHDHLWETRSCPALSRARLAVATFVAAGPADVQSADDVELGDGARSQWCLYLQCCFVARSFLCRRQGGHVHVYGVDR